MHCYWILVPVQTCIMYTFKGFNECTIYFVSEVVKINGDQIILLVTKTLDSQKQWIDRIGGAGFLPGTPTLGVGHFDVY